MVQANVLEAKTNLSALLHLLETGQEDRIVIARRNQPVAQITLCEASPSHQRIGVARNASLYAEGWDAPSLNDEVAALFGVGA